MRRALFIVGKNPHSGRAKTRLSPPLSSAAAGELYAAFLLDTVELGQRLGWECVSVVHPSDAETFEALSALLPAGVRCVPQAGHGLGDALAGAFETHFDEGFERVVLLGSDSPSVPVDLVHQAAADLARHDLTIGPSADGGYVLLGLREPQPSVFEGIDWSTPRVYRQTLERAAALALTVRSLAEWYDVDSAADLLQLQVELRAREPQVAPRTRAVLARMALPV